ncbi:MAG TPA: hypothetical protein DCS07_18440 [Bdellovibrionales bacterium]|nr:MAG: hypothetical protein A2Z97_09565 [Bdellovibrionales bacterium GWB1_52_6]OFZ03643.1 MAG: hypothetical protein A2X97_00940 [Bdellovibrionales bacterium GWA1_52_35]OFZ41335.1 MAG: hypothetical protein A2070_08905 [Bdellovibrionales bacterium GWC1_52_8]HAR44582.1 hypothetical protein [Bdellovibrionales bacterium]HCM40633.1 hypothetical protein [Bdellovibrionales bacterium]
MSQPTKPPQKPSAATPAAAPAKPTLSPEAELSGRIKEIEARLLVLNGEIKVLKGKLSNRDPLLAHKLKKENELLKGRIGKLEQALAALLADSFKPRQPDESNIQLDVMRRAAVEYFKKANVAPELWKNIES